MENLVDKVHSMWTWRRGSGPRRVDRAARLRSIVDRGSAENRVRRRLAGTQRMGARARWCSPVAVEDDEPDEVVSEGCSPEHERRRRGQRDGGEEWRRLELGAREK
jgi:hypothetical protein